MSAEALFDRMFSGAMTEDEIATVLTEMHTRGETSDDIIGAVRAAWKVRVPFEAPGIDAIDTCGTGGDGLNTFNVSTAVALAAAAMGIFVIKHGNRASSSRCGSADVLEALGMTLERDADAWRKELAERRFAFLFAPAFHPSFRTVSAVRKRLGHRTIFNLVGPLLNPAGVDRQVMGVFDRKWVEPVARALLGLGRKRALIVHGSGTDEITPWGTTLVAEIKDGRIATYEVSFDDGVAADVAGADAEANAEIIKNVLAGKAHATAITLVALNLAAAMVVSGRGDDIAEALPRARAFLLGGEALRYWRFA